MKKKATVLSLGSLFVALILFIIFVVPVLAAAPTILTSTLSIAENKVPGDATTPNKITVNEPEGQVLEFQELSGDGMDVFDIGVNSGVVTLAPGQSLDYETKKTYTLQIRVQDTESLTDEATITINVTDVSDEPPSINAGQSFNIAENSSNNTLLGKIAFSDEDVNDTHTFTIEPGDANDAFLIEPDAEIRVKNSTKLNHEVNDQFVFEVTVTDLGGQSDTASVTVNVTDVNENPNVSDTPFNGLSEMAPNGTVVGTVTATDPENDPLTFTRTSGSAAFAINATTGQVTVANNTLLNFETQPSPTFVVTVSDGKGGSDTATITVNLVDANDPPRVTGGGIPDVIVNEGTASATRNLWPYFEDDEDSDNELDFTIQDNDNPGLFSPPPSINPATGVLTMNFANGATGVAEIIIRATDTGGEFVQDTFKVDFNEAPDAVGYSDVTVLEDAENYSINLYTGFTDAEEPSSALNYEIPSEGVSNKGLFTSVAINLPNLILNFAPDAHGQSSITVRATDAAGLSAETTFSVKVNPVNDQPTTTGIDDVDVSEDAENTVIELFKAFNDKEDEPKQLTYTVTANSNTDLFDAVTIDPAQSTLTLDYKANMFGQATLTVKAEDRGITGVPGSKLSVSTSFKVTVGEINDLPVLQNITKEVTEDKPYTFTQADFTSKFSDADEDPLVNVSIITLPDKGKLKLDGADVAPNQVISAANLNKLAFIPAENWDEGFTSFQWNASDGKSFAVAPALVTFTVKADNDAPTIGNVVKTGQEGVNVLFAQSDFSSMFTDVDGDPLNKIRIEELPANGQLKLGNVNVTLNQQINAANIADLRYVPNAFFFGEDSFDWSGSDGLLYSSPAQVILTIEAKNDAPTLDLNGDGQGTGFSATFVAGGPPVKIVGQGVVITDVDDTQMDGASVIIINAQHGTKEILDADVSDTNITKQFNAGSGLLTLSGADTIANYEKVLKTLTYKIESDVANINTEVVRNISVRVNDGDLNSNDTTSKVTVINPRIQITVSPRIQSVNRGDPAIFKVLIENTGSVDLQNIVVSAGAVTDCNREFDTLAAGKKLDEFACYALNVQGRIDNLVKVTALEPQTNTQVSDEDTAVARVVQHISINISPAPGESAVLVKGQDAVFDVTVVNPSESTLTEVAVKAFVDYDLAAVNVNTPAALIPAPECDKDIGTLGGGKETTYRCTIPNVQQSFEIEVQTTAKLDGITPTDDFDIGEISVLSMSLEVFAVPFELPAGEPTVVEYSMTLSNISNIDLTLSALTSSLHGNLLSAANGNITENSCAGLNLNVPAGEVRTCSYKVTLSLPSGAITNVITADATGGDNQQLTVTDEVIISVGDFSPLSVVVSADPANVVAPGGLVNLTVQVTNGTGSELTLDSLTDAVVGDLDGQGNCELPRAIQGNGTYACTYTITISNKEPGDVVTHNVTAIAGTREASNSVSITVTSTELVYMHLPTVAGIAMAGEPNNGICSALQVGLNQNYYFHADDSNDWYRFAVGSAGSARIKLGNFLVTKGQLLVYSGDCTNPIRIGHNGDTGVVPAREIVLEGLQASETYYIWVLSSEGLNPDSPYSLRVEVAGQ